MYKSINGFERTLKTYFDGSLLKNIAQLMWNHGDYPISSFSHNEFVKEMSRYVDSRLRRDEEKVTL